MIFRLFTVYNNHEMIKTDCQTGKKIASIIASARIILLPTVAFPHFKFEKFAMTVSKKNWTLLVKIFYKIKDDVPVTLQIILNTQWYEKRRWSGDFRDSLKKWFRNSKRKVLTCLVEGGKELIRCQMKKWPQQCKRSRVVVCNLAAHWRLTDHRTDLQIWCIKFCEIFCIAINTKMAMWSICCLLTCQQERLFATGNLAHMEAGNK